MPTSRPTVSVVIPCYNSGRFLSSAIDSVLAQTVDDYEIIIVDDGSSDHTANVARGYRNQPVHYVFQENAGPAAARNTGMHRARGEFIALLDADDEFLPGKLDAQLRILRQCPQIAVLGSPCIRIDEEGVPFFIRRQSRMRTFSAPEQLVANRLFVSSALFRRKAALDIGGFDPTLRGSEDWDFFARMALAGHRLANTAQPLFCYRFVRESVSLDTAMQLQMRRRILDKLFDDPRAHQWAACRKPAEIRVLLNAVAGALLHGDDKQASQLLRQALALEPSLAETYAEQFVDIFVAWSLIYRVRPPLRLLGKLWQAAPSDLVLPDELRDKATLTCLGKMVLQALRCARWGEALDATYQLLSTRPLSAGRASAMGTQALEWLVHKWQSRRVEK